MAVKLSLAHPSVIAWKNGKSELAVQKAVWRQLGNSCGAGPVTGTFCCTGPAKAFADYSNVVTRQTWCYSCFSLGKMSDLHPLDVFGTRLLHAGIIRLPMLEGSDIAISDCCRFCGVYECSYLSFWQLFYLIYRHSPLVLLWYVARDFWLESNSGC